MRIKNLQHPRLAFHQFAPRRGETWCVYGSNSSGINEFLQLLTGELDNTEADQLEIPGHIPVISFSEQQKIFEDEIAKDDTDFLDKIDPGTPASAFLPKERLDDSLIDSFKLRHVLDNGYRQLSSGQARKLLLLRALLSDHPYIIIDSPYDGLDVESCRELNRAIEQIPQNALSLICLVRNFEDIPAWCSHLAYLHEGVVRYQGEKGDKLQKIVSENNRNAASMLTDTGYSSSAVTDKSTPLVSLKNGFASYADTRVFAHLDLQVYAGDHTLITGPNGCGKSTLLHIITGDNPHCYTNELYLFGRRRGSGESIWDIKKHMGIVSPELHRNYRVPGSCLEVVLSGYFDSIGLYDKVTGGQAVQARKWLSFINLSHLETTPFRRLAYGEQRLILIARALIKEPPLLILDEPTQGLDGGSRAALLDFLEKAARTSPVTILYVSHRRDEFRPFYKQHLHLEEYSSTDYYS